MKTMSEMIEIHSHDDAGFKRMVEYKAWVAALLNDCEMYTPEKVSYFQKHMLTDEVFILLSGKCTLFEAGDGEHPGRITPCPLEPMKLYNVKAGVWHTHLLAPGTKVVVVENSDTGLANSPIEDLTPEQKQIMADLF